MLQSLKPLFPFLVAAFCLDPYGLPLLLEIADGPLEIRVRDHLGGLMGQLLVDPIEPAMDARSDLFQPGYQGGQVQGGEGLVRSANSAGLVLVESSHRHVLWGKPIERLASSPIRSSALPES
ncbi:MAG: hypothetical protein IRY99_06850 [Isosphaeraceae bacterium]|nr:hypothetical protein [Isosphaeraceae bacterium]